MKRTHRTALAGLTAVLVTTTLVVVGLPAAASAHVTVNPSTLTQGGFGRVAFRVPNESATASTTKVEVFLPEDQPISSVSTMPVPGWRVTLVRRTLDQPIDNHGRQITEVVSQITWSATGSANQIGPGQFQEFPVSMGPLPQTDQLIFKALQTYSDGTVVRWIDEPAEGRELEHPAPILALAPAAGSQGVAVGAETEDGGGTVLPTVLSVFALLIGLAGLALGGLAYTQTRRERPTNP